MRIEAVGYAGYDYWASVPLIRRIEAQERRQSVHKKEQRRKYLKLSNQLAMEMSDSVTFYDATGKGHSYAYCNFETAI